MINGLSASTLFMLVMKTVVCSGLYLMFFNVPIHTREAGVI